MNLRTLIPLVTCLFSLVFSANGQLKKINFDNNVKISKSDFGIEIKNKAPNANNIKNDVAFNFNTLASRKFNDVFTGLTPGVLNDRLVPSYIEGVLKNHENKGVSKENLALQYLTAAAPMMKIKKPLDEFYILNVETDNLNMTHVRMQQHVKGIPIYGSEILIHGSDQNFNFLNGTYFPTIELDNVIPVISKDTAIAMIKQEMGIHDEYQNSFSDFGDLSPVSELLVYPINNQFKLAYHVTIYKNLIDRWECFIDAQNGEVLNKYQSICKFHNHHSNHIEDVCIDNVHVPFLEKEEILVDGQATANALDLFGVNRIINTYQVSNRFYMIDGSRDIFSSTPTRLPDNPSGVIWTVDALNKPPLGNSIKYEQITTSNNVWNNKTAVSAHYNGGKAFEYFRNTHNRKSINGSGGNIISLINVADDNGSSLDNAFWNGQAMFYGNGFTSFFPLARGLDVAGHEMTHGVVQSTANLEYQGESGALNESFADIFASMIDRDDWKIGEDVVKLDSFPSGALRNLEDPHNGASTNNFNAGWQPRHYDERYMGSKDNGGVHINSGIPNHAFFKFATAVGKDKAEKVFYRALATYLTKSSKFVDCRIAVIKATTDLYSTAEINAAKKAFDEVGIFGESGGSYETDIETNPGQEFVLTTGGNNVGIFIYNTNGTSLGQISNKTVLSKPSISDDGSEIVFVGTDNKIYYIQIDWTKNPISPQEQVISANPVWRNAIISKDGLKIAALTTVETNEIQVFYFGGTTVTSNVFELYNPTYTQGITTGDVNYADAMEFDVTGEYIIYDAENEIRSNTSGSIKYWDIGFIKVWNNASNSFSLGEVDKLYSSLPEDVSIGNPAFSKNSPYIIAFDYIDENNDVSILGGNIETGDVKLIYENNTLGYPNFSSKDDKVVFDNEGSTSYDIGISTLKSNKIESASTPVLWTKGKRWGVWFSNGKRKLTDVINFTNEMTSVKIISNPVNDQLVLNVNTDSHVDLNLKITDLSGKVLYQNVYSVNNSELLSINTSKFNNGMYFLTLNIGDHLQTLKFIKGQ